MLSYLPKSSHLRLNLAHTELHAIKSTHFPQLSTLPSSPITANPSISQFQAVSSTWGRSKATRASAKLLSTHSTGRISSEAASSSTITVSLMWAIRDWASRLVIESVGPKTDSVHSVVLSQLDVNLFYNIDTSNYTL